MAFAMASVVADEYDDWRVDALSYGTAAAVGLSRVYQDRHWASDVMGGATLGIAVGKWCRRRAARKDGLTVSTDGRRVFLSRKF
jgi:membrane-associated phospholipid phosphatase